MTNAFIRFWQKVELSTDGCWLWTASKTKAGYGHFEGTYAHRWIWKLFNGPVPTGLELDHLCRCKSCVNPAHLEAVTRRENLMRSPIVIFKQKAALAHCKHGHSFEEYGYRDRNGRRRCKLCVYRSNHKVA